MSDVVKWECQTCGAEQAVSRDETPGWLVGLLTEASGVAHGNPNAASMTRVLQAVPEQYMLDAGLTWASVQFDDSDD